ncbi:hypothetical protein K501DRAFT_308762 [Backusella circina FSU 941]|nr:hypothetical protein K501DRAFT_308762 [Backusella circina FSU 941]
MITCNMSTELEHFDNSKQRRSRLKQRSRLPRYRYSETSQVTHQKTSRTQNSIELDNIQQDLIDYRLSDFLIKSQQAIVWYSRAKLEIMTLIKLNHHPNHECDGVPCPFIEDEIEEKYSLWKSKMDTFFKTIHNDVKNSLDRLLSIAPLEYIKKNHYNGFVIYQQIYQLNSEFMQWEDYSQRVYKQQHQINKFMRQVYNLTLEIERLLRSPKIDVETYNKIKERITTVVIDEFKQITYPEAPSEQLDFNYRKYMLVSGHKVKLIELNQKLANLVQ